MVLAIILGALAGVLGFLPLFIGLRIARRVTTTSNFSHMSILIIALIASFILMFALAIVCVSVARDVAIFFVLAEAVALSIAAIVFGIMRSRNNGRER